MWREWLTRPFHAELERIRTRLAKLEAERTEREVELHDLLEKLHRHLLRMRQRDRRDREAADKDGGMDEVSRMILDKRRRI